MNYVKIYTDLINKGLERGHNKKKLSYFTESHHIIPKCLNGVDRKINRVLLTAREHYIAHKLLIKMYPDIFGLINALSRFMYSNRGDENKVKITSREFERFRKLLSEKFTEMLLSDKHPTRGKTSWNKGIPMKEESKAIMRLSKLGGTAWNKGLPSKQKGVPRRKEIVDKMANSHRGMKRSLSAKLNIASAQRKAPHWKFEKELYNEWLLSDMIGCCRFRKIVVAKGYPDVQYQKMVLKWKSGDIPQ